MAIKKRPGKRHANIPLGVLHDESVRRLSHAEFRVLVLLAGEYNGGNNGGLGITKSQAERQGIAGKTLYSSLKRLVDENLIDITYPASRTPPRPTMHALTWRPIDDTQWSSATRVPARIFKWRK